MQVHVLHFKEGHVMLVHILQFTKATSCRVSVLHRKEGSVAQVGDQKDERRGQT